MTLHWGIAISESFFCRGILFSVDDGFLSHVHSSGDIRCPFSHWSMRHYRRSSSGVLYTGAYPFQSMMVFLGIVVSWRRLDSFHIGVRDVIGWFLWCDHESIAFSSLLAYFFEMIGSGHGHLWEHAAEFSHFRVCPILGHNPFIGGWS